MSTLNDPDTQLNQFFLQLGARRASSRRWPAAGRSCSRTWPTPSRALSADPAGAAADHRAVARRRSTAGDRALPGPAPVPGRLRRPVAAPAAGRRRAAALAAGDQQRVRGRHAGAAAHRGPERAASSDVRRARRPVRQPEHAAGAARPAHDCRRSPRRRCSSSRPTRRSATTRTTSSYPLGEPQSEVGTGRHGPAAGSCEAAQPDAAATVWATARSSRPADVPPGVDPTHGGRCRQLLAGVHTPPYQPAIDAQGNADCQIGQNGYLKGPLGGEQPDSRAATRAASEKNGNADSPTYLTDASTEPVRWQPRCGGPEHARRPGST